MTAPRRIGITVEQPQDGSYYWVIHEDVQCDGKYQKIERAEQACRSYSEALASGYGTLRRLNGQEDQDEGLRVRAPRGLAV